MTGTDIGTLLLGLAAFLTALGSLRRGGRNSREVAALRADQRHNRQLIIQLRRHLRIALAALSREVGQEPVVRSERKPPHAPPH